MFVQPKMGYVRAKIGLTRQFDQRQPGNYLHRWLLSQTASYKVIFANKSGMNAENYHNLHLRI